VPQVELPPNWHVFVMGNYQALDINDTAEAMGGKGSGYNTTLGVDVRACDNLVVGLAFNGFRSDIDLSDSGSANVNGGKGSLYATWFNNSFHVDAAVGAGWNSYEHIKRPALAGVTPDGAPVVGLAYGDTSGQEFDALLGVGYDVKMDSFTLTPNASVSYTALSIDGYTETGSLAPLKIDRINADSLASSLGLTLAYNAKIGGMPVRPELGAAWRHEFMDDPYHIDSQLASGAGSAFRVDSTKLGNNSLPVWLGVNVQVSSRVGLHLVGESTLCRQNGKEASVMVGVDCAL